MRVWMEEFSYFFNPLNIAFFEKCQNCYTGKLAIVQVKLLFAGQNDNGVQEMHL